MASQFTFILIELFISSWKRLWWRLVVILAGKKSPSVVEQRETFNKLLIEKYVPSLVEFLNKEVKR